MRPSKALPILALAASTAVSSVSAQICGLDICVYINENADTIRFRMETTASRGWMGFGINTAGGTGMNGAEVFCAEKNADGTVSVSHRYASSQATPQIISGSSLTIVPNATSTANQKFVATFDRAKTSTSSQIATLSTSAAQGVIFAWGSGGLADHGSNHFASQATLLAPSNAYSSSSSSTGPSQSIPTDSTSANDAAQASDRLRVAHGLLMFIAWCILAPAGIFVSRYMKVSLGVWWFRFHIALTGVGVGALTIVAFILSLYVTPSSRHFSVADPVSGSHRVLGLIVVILTVFQVVIGIVIDRLFKPERKGTPWHDKAHWWLGRLSLLAAIANTYVGILYYDNTYGSLTKSTTTGLYAALSILVALVAVVFGVFEYRVGATKHVEEVKLNH
ncbi:hypothetical protein BJ742DRAFT_843792 [Cladochytrium replicatum]|nr:hypothetical protein BJ742DRAFT_843792 [Cladochytrium replicatum]